MPVLFTCAALQEESRTLGNKMEEERVGWRREQCSLWHSAFQKVRDQPGGPGQLTAAAFPSLMRMVVVTAAMVETVSGEDSRKEGRAGNGMETSRGT